MNSVFPLASVIAFRYLRSKKSNSSISFFSLVSFLGLALGLAALIIVTSVMNGFELEMHKRILNMLPHVSVENHNNIKSDIKRNSPINQITINKNNWQDVASIISSDEVLNQKIIAASPYIHLDALLNSNTLVKGIRVVGIEAEYEKQTSLIDDFLLAGSLDNLTKDSFNVVLGADIAREMNIVMGQKITLVFPNVDEKSKRLKASYYQFTVSGFFQVGAEADTFLAFVNLSDASSIKYQGEKIDGFRYQLNNVYDAEHIQIPLDNLFSNRFNATDSFTIDTWVKRYGQLFQTVKIEKLMTATMLMLIVLVAAFNTVSSLSMLVTEKHTSIAVLRTMGLTKNQVLMVFFYQGLYISALGIILGLFFGLTIAINLSDMVDWLNSFEIFWIAPLEAHLKWQDVFWLTLCAGLISIFSSLLPAINASKIEPADAVRYH